jgi:SAM-dependent methyltransferase
VRKFVERAAARVATSIDPRRVGRVVPVFGLGPQVVATRDDVLRSDRRTCLNQLCDISDWRAGPLTDLMAEFGGAPLVHRKAWEEASCLLGLRNLGALTADARGLSVGAGVERAMFWLANHVGEIVATDLYDDTTGYGKWGRDVLAGIKGYAPFPYREDRLVALCSSGTTLAFRDGSFDFAYSLSSIEHFGGHDAAAAAVREMGRVVKPGGVVCVVTELVLNDIAHDEYFTYDELRELISQSGMDLVEPEFDLRISESLLAYPINIDREPDLGVTPHIVCVHDMGTVFTSVIFFLRAR